MVRILLALWFSLVLSTVPLGAQTRSGDAAVVGFRADQGPACVEGLLDVAGWARDKRMYAWEARLHAGVLTIDPNHSQARRALRYFKIGSRWVQSKGFHNPRNHGDRDQLESLVDEFMQRMDRAFGPYRDGLLARIGNRREPVSARVRQEILRQLLVFQPDDEELRSALGEVRYKGEWVLAESARTLRRKGMLRAVAQDCLAQVVEIRPATYSRDESRSTLDWNAARKSRDVRVVGSVGVAEIEDGARTAQAVGLLFEQVFDHFAPFRKGYTVLILQGPKDLARLGPLAREGASLPNDIKAPSTVGGWLSWREVAQWSPNKQRRLDGLARQTLGAMLIDAYGLDARNGWIWEGLGIFLIDQLVGSRRTYFVERPEGTFADADNLWKVLEDDKTDWLEIAAKRQAEDRWPGLAFLIGRSVGSLRDEDLLASYVLAAYVLEGWPQYAGELIQRIGAGGHPVDAFEAVLGMTLPETEIRMERWLQEVLRLR